VRGRERGHGVGAVPRQARARGARAVDGRVALAQAGQGAGRVVQAGRPRAHGVDVGRDGRGQAGRVGLCVCGVGWWVGGRVVVVVRGGERGGEARRVGEEKKKKKEKLSHRSLGLVLGPQLGQAAQVFRVLHEAADLGDGGRPRVGGLFFFGAERERRERESAAARGMIFFGRRRRAAHAHRRTHHQAVRWGSSAQADGRCVCVCECVCRARARVLLRAATFFPVASCFPGEERDGGARGRGRWRAGSTDGRGRTSSETSIPH
jgi:hypothetical protein